ncbi:uncharacterized protein [Panulirus ornatus]|uniref:uncharacterized protein isoform X2 n=1 Tax=Panulirus ornatus TaxID=150431 RepID=UPI003A8B1F2F
MAGAAPTIHLSRASTSVSDDHDDHHDRIVGGATEEELWEALAPHHLVTLRRSFSREWSGRASLAGAEEEQLVENRHLTRQQLVDAFTSILGTERYVGVCGAIFDAIVASTTSDHPGASSLTTTSSSTSSLGGSVSNRGISWSSLVSYLASRVASGGHDAPPEPLFCPTPRYRQLTHTKREGVAGVVMFGRRNLLVVGTRGGLTKMSHSARQQRHARLQLDAMPDVEQLPHALRKVNLGTWVVDVALVEEEVAVVAATSSTLHLVEASSGAAQELLRITNLPHMPSCLAAGCVEEGRWIAVGDEKGSVHLLRCPHPLSDLLTRSRSEGLTILTWQEVCGRGQDVRGRGGGDVRGCSWAGVHGSCVRRLHYQPSSSIMVSCSGDPRTSLVLWAPDHATKTYTFSIPRGVRLFAVDWTLHVLVTGSSDGRIRVWNPYVPEAALATLPPAPGRAPPADLLICPRRPAILTCDADAVVRVYGLEGGRCLQTIALSFPGGCGGLAPRPLILLPSGHLMVACRDYLASLTRSQPQHQPALPSASWHSDSEEGDGERDEDVVSCHAKCEDDQLFEEATLMSSDEKRRRAEMRRLVRQGAAFCCLTLNTVSPPDLPPDLPLPPRLVALGLTASDPKALLSHLPVSIITSALKSGSSPATVKLPSTQCVTPTPRPSRPPSATALGRSKSPGPACRPPDNLSSGRHLSPAWRPHPPAHD